MKHRIPLHGISAYPQFSPAVHMYMCAPVTRIVEASRSVTLVLLCSNAQIHRTLKHRFPHKRDVRQNCCSGTDRNKGVQSRPSLMHELRRHAPALPSNGTSQQERFLAFENTPAESHDDDHDHHRHPINDSNVHKVLAWVFTRVGLLQLAAQLRGKTWNAITIAGLMAVALLTAWAGGTQAVSAHIYQQISTAATASIYLLAGIPELVDLCFDLTAGHIDTHVLTTLAVFGTLAIGGALEVTFIAASCLVTMPAHRHNRQEQLNHASTAPLMATRVSVKQSD